MATIAFALFDAAPSGAEIVSTELRDVLAIASSSYDTITVVALFATVNDKDSNPLFDGSFAELSRMDRYRKVRGILEKQQSQSVAAARRFLDSLADRGTILHYNAHWIIPAVSVSLVSNQALSLEMAPGITALRLAPRLESIPTEKARAKNQFDLPHAPEAESNLRSIGADTAWALGYTGAGRLVCSFDVGVEGTHPALTRSWRGKVAEHGAAWFDPVWRDSTPHAYGHSLVAAHGTQTMGIMVGIDNETGDTVGVAPGAEWIAAAVVDIPGASIIDAFEWAADPDGDPNTIADVPDVINHSWGIPNNLIGCSDIFWQMIDHTEALGIVNIFAAGNEGGAGAFSIRNPANRAQDSLDCLAVGSVDHRAEGGPRRAYNSSLGPSDCDSVSVKPNLMAPGVGIRSSTVEGGYEFNSGTSMAAPHLSGAVAMLRQKNPEASSRAIKEALLAGANDLGVLGPDNAYGWGYISIPKSLSALAPNTEPRLRIFSVVPWRFDSLNTVRAKITLRNASGDLPIALSVRGEITRWHNALQVIDGAVLFGNVSPGETVTSVDDVVITVDDTVSAGERLWCELTLTDEFGVREIALIQLQRGESLTKSFYTHQTDRLRFTVSNFGEFGFANGSFAPLGKDGFSFDGDNGATLFEMALIMGTDSAHISDGARNAGFASDRDFAVTPGGNLVTSTTTADSATVTYGSFNDSHATHPLGLEVHQRTVSWRHDPSDGVALEFRIVNRSASTISGLRVGLFADWDILDLSKNQASFDASAHLGFVFGEKDGEQAYRGLVTLLEPLAAHSVFDMFEVGTVGDPFTEGVKESALSSGFSNATSDTPSDLAHCVALGAYTLGPGDSVVTAFGVVAGNTLTGITNAAMQLMAAYDSVRIDPPDPTPVLPSSLWLAQNYPNPFNPVTTIEFALKEDTPASLEIFDLLGRKVRTLARDIHERKVYKVSWDATDDMGRRVASGVYVCRLSAGSQVLHRKLTLLR